jgi:hypothetical protein
MQETRAYGLLIEGNEGGAIEVLGRVSRYPAQYPWEVEMVGRASDMRTKVEAGRASDVLEQLEKWRRASAKVIGVELG